MSDFMKKFLFLVPFLVLVIVVFLQSSQKLNRNFFMQYDSYVAAPAESELEIALTCFGEKKTILNMMEASTLSFDEANNMKIQDFIIEESGYKAGFYSCSVTLHLNFLKKGSDEVSYITATYSDGKTESFPIGSWYFDIDESNAQNVPVNIWSSPIASSNNEKFPYSYSVEDLEYRINAIQYGKNLFFDIPSTNYDGLVEGTIPITKDATVKYIRPKLLVISGEKTYTVYGIGCYCGALNIHESEILEAQAISKGT